MKIVGNIKDYYDSAIGAYGPSNTPLYNRMRSTTTIEDFSRHTLGRLWYQPKNAFSKQKQTYHNLVMIGVCGKIWIFARNTFLPGAGPMLDVLKQQDEIKQFLENARADKSRRWMRERMEASDILERTGVEAFTPIHDERAFIELKTPVFAYFPPVDMPLALNAIYTDKCAQVLNDYGRKKGLLVLNPILKEFDFQKYMDPYTIYQEIEMFLGNVLTNNTTPKMPVGSDKVIAESKGFTKWSFRTPPAES